MRVELPVFGVKAREIADRLKLQKNGDYANINGKVLISYRSVEGHPKIVVELEL